VLLAEHGNGVSQRYCNGSLAQTDSMLGRNAQELEVSDWDYSNATQSLHHTILGLHAFAKALRQNDLELPH
jgi:hypothetical protein